MLDYDANGNMTSRQNTTGTQTLTFDVENRLTQVQGTGGGYSGATTFVYDGDGKRIKKTVDTVTTVYPNRYYEKKITAPAEETSYYYLGDRLIALKKGAALEYVHQDHLSSSSVSTDSSGAQVSSLKFFSFGAARSSTGTLGTDKKYTGQRLDGTGLYFYNARYYDAELGRFVSPDAIVPDAYNPQAFNRYSYVYNNSLKYVDSDGQRAVGAILRFLARYALPFIIAASTGADIGLFLRNPSLITGGTVILDLLDPNPVPWGVVKNGLRAVGKNVEVKWATRQASLTAEELAASINAAKQGTHLGEKKGLTVIGRYRSDGGYILEAQHKRANYFDLGDAGKGLSQGEKDAANMIFLDQRIAAGDEFVLSGVDSIEAARGLRADGTGLGSEIDYLFEHGYEFLQRDDGVYLTIPTVA
ncbi:MAG: RHS repeat-associated core domain-containing protein [Chloroflexi bacterium]|nr:RHS repeat-associated core domain-containing protein [Chloroflexota bacterium]